MAEAPSKRDPRAELIGLIEDKLNVVSAFLARPPRWPRSLAPERLKALSRISARLLELRFAVARANDDLVQPLLAAVGQVDTDAALERAWDQAEQLKVLLIHLATPDELETKLRLEDNHDPEDKLSWTARFGAQDADALLAKPPGWEAIAVARFTALYEERVDQVRHDRAQARLRRDYMVGLTVVLGVALAVTAIISMWEGGWWILPENSLMTCAIAAGALGSILSGTYKLRDQAMGIRQLRSFWPALLAQPFVGASAALVVDAVLTSGLIRFGDHGPSQFIWQHHVVFGFIAGFSEPFFLGVVGRLASLGRDKT